MNKRHQLIPEIKDLLDKTGGQKRTVAKILLEKYPELFSNLENSRAYIRVLTGNFGAKHSKFQKIEDKWGLLPEESEDEPIDDYILPLHEKLGILCDIHSLYYEPNALYPALDYLKRHEADAILINGDMLDMYQLSRFDKNPSKAKFGAERKWAIDFLKMMQEEFGNVYWKKGNHECYASDTQVLTENGFVKFSELSRNVKVAQFDNDMNISFAYPVEYVEKEFKGNLIKIENGYSKQIVTPYHDVVVRENGVNVKIKAKDITIDNLLNLPYAGIYGTEAFVMWEHHLEEVEYDGLVYCVEMPLGTVVTRIDGKIAFSGNCRYELYLKRNAPAVFDDEFFNFENLFHFEGSNVKIIGNKQIVKHGKMNIIHGDEIRAGGVANIARTKMLQANNNIAFGHHHKTDVSPRKDINGNLTVSQAIGCLCKLRPAYMPINQWNNGFALNEIVDDSGKFKFHNKWVIDREVL